MSVKSNKIQFGLVGIIFSVLFLGTFGFSQDANATVFTPDVIIGVGDLNGPSGLAVDSSGNLYVADWLNNRVQKFDSAGAFDSTLAFSFNGPYDIEIDSNDNVYVTEFQGNGLHKFDSAGVHQPAFAVNVGSNLIGPSGISVDSADRILVADTNNHRVAIFDSDGNFLTSFGSFGSGNGQFHFPNDIAIDSLDNIYVGDYFNHRVQKFDSSGGYVSQFGSFGSGPANFNGPIGLAIDSSDNLYVADFQNNRVQKFDTSFLLLDTITSSAGFNLAYDVAVGICDNLYVADFNNDRIQVFGTCTPNSPPTADAGGPYMVAVDTPINLDASLSSDPDLDALTYSWTSNGGIITNPTLVNPTFESDTSGVFTAYVTVTDPSGAEHTAETLIAVYDPTGGFVTGGGWILSLEGSCNTEGLEDGICDTDETGKANFGFVSKYKNGATTPTGNTEFKFKAGNLNFHSDTYEWLVIAGHQAKYKGEGTINGAGNYGFMLSAVDEKLTPSTDVDLFRMKIWDKDNADTIVYDNNMGAADDADASTEIGGGSIVIHKAQ